MKNLRPSRGFSLIEMMIAASIGMTVLISAGSVLVSAQRMSGERSLRIYVLQSMMEAMQFIQSDLRRVGFNEDVLYEGNVADRIDDVIQIDDSLNQNSLLYRYQKQGETYVTHLTGDISHGKLLLCVKKQDPDLALDSGACRQFSLLDDQRLVLKNFQIQTIPNGALTADSRVKLSMSVDVKNGDGTYLRSINGVVDLRGFL